MTHASDEMPVGCAWMPECTLAVQKARACGAQHHAGVLCQRLVRYKVHVCAMARLMQRPAPCKTVAGARTTTRGAVALCSAAFAGGDQVCTERPSRPPAHSGALLRADGAGSMVGHRPPGKVGQCGMARRTFGVLPVGLDARFEIGCRTDRH